MEIRSWVQFSLSYSSQHSHKPQGKLQGRSDTVTAGRPSKYSEAYCEEAVQFLAGGYSLKAFAGEIGVSLSTVYKWMEEKEEFSEAIKTGQAKSALWWEEVLMNVAKKGEGNASAAIFGVKNRSQEEWRDKQEHDHTSSDKSMTPQQIVIRAADDDNSDA